ncbi:chemotaxis protein CheB [Roseovarius sp.]|uniref:chemotaxis protein CheB n=1 Tax=Roseovarius sp. TaxID=1486281 RepID=UPI003B5CDFF9
MPAKKDFPIVGIGASAGGLEAYKNLLRSLPDDTGAAFILIQHLDPNHPSMMADLLARQTKMTVVQAENEMRLAPNTVYVIPPGKFIRLLDHGLILDEPVEKRGMRMAIDYFFRSLAEGRGEKSIGIVLSGTGSDGTLGLREIKAAGGMVMVQDPEEAEHDGMPRSAANTGLVDFLLPIAEMPDRLAQFIKHPYLREPREEEAGLAKAAPDGFNEVLHLLRTQTDFDFRCYKKGTVERRIQRRMGLGQFDTLADYVAHMRDNSEEVHHLFRDLLIGVTRFFREPETWDALADRVIEPMLDRKKKDDVIRAWVPGCASGEEAYTLAATLFARMDRRRAAHPVQIFATDLNARAIEVARAGRYPLAALPDIPERIRQSFVVEEDEWFMVNKRLRETVVFATQNVISDPPFSRLDIITCRNLMIYLESDVQQRMIEMFHFALGDEGHLLLGNSENAERPGRLFVPIDKANRIYRKTVSARVRPGKFAIAAGGKRQQSRPAAKETSYATVSDLARRRLMDRFVPASVVVNMRLEVLYFHGPVRDYLDFPAGEPTSILTEMILPEMRSKLRFVIHALQSGQADAEAEALRVPRGDRELNVRINGERVDALDRDPTYLIHFHDASEPRDATAGQAAREKAREEADPEERDAVAALEYELQSTREDLQSTIEEMETSNEELKASNEEVMSMNEELQSTNEELETSREELQSLNEELSTVNSQLEDKIEELEQTNNDLNNLLTSIDIGVIFLDTNLLIRRFTPAMKDVMRIIDGDIGRPAEDIAMRVHDSKLIEDAQTCLEKLTEIEAEISTDEGNHRIRRMRPYRTSENQIQGVVITYTDVTNLQNARAAARRREAQQQAVAELGRAALAGGELQAVFDMAVRDLAEHMGVRFTKVLELDPDGLNLTLRSGVGWTHATIGSSKVGSGIESQAGYTLQQRGPVVVNDFREERRFSAPRLLKDHHILCGASVIIGPTDAPWGVLGVHEDNPSPSLFDTDDINYLQATANVLWLVISRGRALKRIDEERWQLRNMADSLPILFAVINADQRYEFVNSGYEFWGASPDEIEGQRVSDLVNPEAYEAIAPHIAAALQGQDQTFEVRIGLGADSEKRDVLVSYAPRRDTDGNVTGFYSAALDVSERKQLERDLAERFDQYRTLGESIPFGVWINDPDGQLSYVSPAFLKLVGKTMEQARSDGLIDCIDPVMREEIEELWRETLASGEPWEREIRIIGADGKLYHTLALGRPICDPDGRITSWVGLNLDITERKAEADRLRVISAELDHRVKNILATVSTITRMTGRSSNTLEGYRDALQARIRAMAAAHRQLADANWQGMPLEQLIETEIDPYRANRNDSIVMHGPYVQLPPRLVQTLALAFHELTTNSSKYGALSQDDGQLDINWKTDDGLEIEWIETGLSGVTPPSSSGFGTTLLTRILAAQGADVTMDYPDTGIRVRISLANLA